MRKCLSNTGGNPTMPTTWKRQRRLKPARPQRKKRAKKPVATQSTGLQDRDEYTPLDVGRGVGEDGHGECQNHAKAETSAFERQPTKVQPRCHVQEESRQPGNNSQLRSSPACPALTQVTRLRVSRSSPTSLHLRTVQWQARRERPQRPESCS